MTPVMFESYWQESNLPLEEMARVFFADNGD